MNVPNLLTLSRLPLSAILFAAIDRQWWPVALIAFLLASLTDWADGYLARLWNQTSAFGRAFDPLIDKVMMGGAFVYLLMVPSSGLLPWMVAVVLARELLVTGLRGYLESLGYRFGADWFGKLKMFLQCIYLGWYLFLRCIEPTESMWAIHTGLLWAMLLATIGSGVQYLIRSLAMLRAEPPRTM